MRESLGLTQADFASLLGVHSMTVSKWERGVTEPTPYQQALINEFALSVFLHKKKEISFCFGDWFPVPGPLALLHYLLHFTFEHRT